MKTNWFQRTLSSILALALVLGYVPVPSFAAAEDGLCAHHTEHTEACGYSPASDGSPCTHEHSEECCQSVTECAHVHDDTCGYVPAVEGHGCECQPDENGEIVHTESCGYVEAAAEIPCGHICSEESGCVKQVLNCPHVHDDACGYAEATPESPCAFVCEACAEAEMEPVPETTEEPVPEATEEPIPETIVESDPELPVESETITQTASPVLAPGEEEDAQPVSGSGVYVNPMYAGEAEPVPSELYPTALLSDTDPYTSIDDMAIPLRAVMCDREESVTFPLEIPAAQYDEHEIMDDLSAVVDQAIAHTGVPTQGDYLRANFYQVTYGYSGSISSTTADLQVTYEFIYNASAEQEAMMDAVVDELLVRLSPSGTDYQKIRKVYDYITQNITYDYANLYDDSYLLKYSPYAALVNKTAVCQGYAGLLYRLALEMGIDCRMITGTSSGENHAWNIIRLEGKYYNADSTWDAGCTEYDWFLLTDGNFHDHTRESAFASESFYAAYPMGTTDYKPSSTLATPVLASVANTAAGVMVTWNPVDGAEKYRVFYKVVGSSGNWAKLADTTSASYTVTSLTGGTKYSFTVRCISADGKSYTSGYDATGKSITWVPQPAISSLTNTSTGVTVKWNPVDGAAKYRVYYKVTGSTASWSTAGYTTDTSYTVTGLSKGTSYAFTLRAIAADGTYSSYNTTGKGIAWVTQLDTPVLTSVANAATGVTVKWNAVSGAVNYRVYYKVAGSTASWSSAGYTTDTSYTVTGLTGGTKYSFTVRCVSADGKSYASGYNTTGKSVTFVPQPAVTSLASSSDGVIVRWSAVEGAAKYRVYYKVAGSTASWSTAGYTTDTSYTVTGLSKGTSYAFTLRAIAADGTYSSYDPAGRSIIVG